MRKIYYARRRRSNWVHQVHEQLNIRWEALADVRAPFLVNRISSETDWEAIA